MFLLEVPYELSGTEAGNAVPCAAARDARPAKTAWDLLFGAALAACRVCAAGMIWLFFGTEVPFEFPEDFRSVCFFFSDFFFFLSFLILSLRPRFFSFCATCTVDRLTSWSPRELQYRHIAATSTRAAKVANPPMIRGVVDEESVVLPAGDGV